jgi:hypothetical protein
VYISLILLAIHACVCASLSLSKLIDIARVGIVPPGFEPIIRCSLDCWFQEIEVEKLGDEKRYEDTPNLRERVLAIVVIDDI